jgi:hypothetical protein
LKFYTIGGFEESIKYTKTFDHYVDENIWKYVHEKIGTGYTSSGNLWFGSNQYPHKLKLSVNRKRTRTDQDWWHLSLIPYGVEYGYFNTIGVVTLQKYKKHSSLTLI